MSERDTHFAGFARLLYEDFQRLAMEDPRSIQDIIDEGHVAVWQGMVEQRIAQRAYDLVAHVLSQFPTSYDPDGVRGTIRMLQDMTQWPEQERFAAALADLAKIREQIMRLPEKEA